MIIYSGKLLKDMIQKNNTINPAKAGKQSNKKYGLDN